MADEQLLTIDGNQYSIRLIKLTREASILDKYARRTINGDLQREIIGCYINYSLTFAFTDEPYKYDLLWQKLVEPVPFHTIILPKNIGYTSAFEAYIANVKDDIEYANPNNGNQRKFNNLSCNIVSRRPNLNNHI